MIDEHGLPAFYVPEGESYRATELTRGPWDPSSQHAGPPCALLGRELDLAGQIEAAQLGRISFEILRPVPIAEVEVEATLVRPGRRVEMLEGTLSHAGETIIRARGWKVRTTDVALDLPATVAAREPAPLPGPGSAREQPFFPVAWEIGYHAAMEVRFVEGAFVDPGPARAWMRMKVPLIEAEPPSARDRVLVAADSGNGVSAPLDYHRYLFINADLTVNLRRLPAGDWVGLDSVSYAESHGVGMSDTTLHDEGGMIGRSTQTLLIATRDGE